MSSKRDYVRIRWKADGGKAYRDVDREGIEELEREHIWEVCDGKYEGVGVDELTSVEKTEIFEGTPPEKSEKESHQLIVGNDPQRREWLKKFYTEEELQAFEAEEELEQKRAKEAQDEKSVDEMTDEELREAWNQSRVEEQSDRGDGVSERWERQARRSNTDISEVWIDNPIEASEEPEPSPEATPEPSAEELEATDLSEEEQEALEAAWSDRGGIWETFAEELSENEQVDDEATSTWEELANRTNANTPDPESEVDSTSIDVLHDGQTYVKRWGDRGKVVIETEAEELCKEIELVEHRDSVTVEEKSEDKWKVVVDRRAFLDD